MQIETVEGMTTVFIAIGECKSILARRTTLEKAKRQISKILLLAEDFIRLALGEDMEVHFARLGIIFYGQNAENLEDYVSCNHIKENGEYDKPTTQTNLKGKIRYMLHKID